MGLFEHWPYTNFHDLNLDWIIKKLPEVFTASAQAVQSAETAVSAKDDAVAAKEAAQSSAENAALSEENAERSAESAQDYAEHIADPVGGLVTTWLDDNIMPTTPPIDRSLSVQDAAADAKATGDAINELRGEINNSIPNTVKRAMDTLFNKMAVEDDDGYTVAYGIFHAWATSLNVISISAVFNQGTNIIYDTDSLNDLRQYLTVTATFSDQSTAEVSDYTLSGDLETGVSEITAAYEGKTSSFNVTVTHSPLPVGYTPYDYLSSNIYGTPSASNLDKTPYIQTLFPASDTDILNYKVKLVYENNFNATTACPFGARNSNTSSATRGCILNLGSTDTVFNFGNNSSQTELLRTALGYAVTLDAKHTIELNSGDILLDGTTVAQTGATSAVQPAAYKWRLFGRKNGDSESAVSLASMIGKVYEFSIRDSGDNYVLNYIPCMRKSDNVYGMYDTVSNAFYSSANEYAFIGGND